MQKQTKDYPTTTQKDNLIYKLFSIYFYFSSFVFAFDYAYLWKRYY